MRQPYNHGIVCHTGLLDKPTSISSYSRSPERQGVYARMESIPNPNPCPGPGSIPSSNPNPSPGHYQSQARCRHLLTALDAYCRTAHTNLPSSGSQVNGDSLFDRFAHRVSLPHPSTGKRHVVFMELAYLLSRPIASVSDNSGVITPGVSCTSMYCRAMSCR